MRPLEQLTSRAAVLPHDDIDTDQIIPARYMKRVERTGFGEFCFHEWRANGVEIAKNPILVSGVNFGCGSSREHAPIALAAAGVAAVVAEFYARIFYRNSINGGYLIPLESKERLIDRVCTGDSLVIDVTAGTLTNTTSGDSFALLPLGEVAPILEAGGLFPYAKKVGMLK